MYAALKSGFETCGQKHLASTKSSMESADLHPFIKAFDDILNDQLKAFINESDTLGISEVKVHAALVLEAFKYQRQFLVVATKCNKPASNDELSNLFMATGKMIQEIIIFREQNKRSKFSYHLSAISEIIPVLGWVTVESDPNSYVKEMVVAGSYYTAGILRDFKKTNPAHATWVKSWLLVLEALMTYIKVHHPTGVSWNVNGPSATLAAA